MIKIEKEIAEQKYIIEQAILGFNNSKDIMSSLTLGKPLYLDNWRLLEFNNFLVTPLIIDDTSKIYNYNITKTTTNGNKKKV